MRNRSRELFWKYLGWMFFLGVAVNGMAGTVYVKSDATGTVDGSSWMNAYTDLQPAIDAAVSGDEVWVAAGTYLPTSWPNGGSTARERHFSLKNGVVVYGGFAGTETLLSQRDVAANETICSGDFNGDDVINGHGKTLVIENNTENAYHVFYHPDGVGLVNTAKLNGVTVTGGRASGLSPHGYGGGMYNYNSSPTLSKCTVFGNSANYGAGVYNAYSSIQLTNCRVADNMANNSGGGLYNTDSSPTLVDCQVIGNSVYHLNQVAASGGGLANLNSTLELTRCSISENASFAGGGGLYNLSSPATTLTECTVAYNSSYHAGAGVLNASFSTATLSRCTLIGNSSSTEGGGLCNSSSTLTLSNCTLVSNTAYSYGGGLYSSDSLVTTLTNCTLTANSAHSGAGLYIVRSPTSAINCTINGNTAYNTGGGIYNSDSNPEVTNSILWGNEAFTDAEIYDDGSSTSTVSHCIVEGGYAGGVAVVDADPLLQTLHDNGGAVATMAIPLGSPAINQGNGASAPSEDARGVARGTPPDVGAYENDGALSPWLEVTPSTVSFGATALLYEQNYKPLVVLGSGLAENVSVVPPLGFEVSADLLAWTSSLDLSVVDGLVDATIYARFRPTVATGYSGTIAVTSGAVITSVSVEGSGQSTPVVYVASDGDNSNGSSWATAFTDLQTGIEQAAQTGVAGSEVWVKTGTYHPNSWPNVKGSAETREKHFSLRNHVSIYGGFGGAETALSQRDVAANPTVLTGDFNNDDSASGSGATFSIENNLENAYHVFYHPLGTGLDNTALIDGFSIVGGNANGSSPHDDGGGVFNDDSSPTLVNCLVTRNSASQYGGGLYSFESHTVRLTTCRFAENTASQNGGGCYNYFSSATLINCTFTSNLAVSGGSIFNYYSSAALSGTELTGNAAGGCIYNFYCSSLTLAACTLSGNTGTYGGALYNNNSSSATLVNCTVTGNTASNYGGGVYSTGSASANLTNCTVEGNVASVGGGIFNSSDARIVNCIFWGNSATTGPVVFDGGASSPYVSHCVVQGGFVDGINIIDQAPLLGLLQDNGGPVQTMALYAGSSAIDAGYTVSVPTTDARGIARPQRLGIDVGAYEYDGADWHTVTFTSSAGGSISGPLSQYLSDGADTAPVTAVPDAEYKFIGWSGDHIGTETPLTLTNVTADMTIAANFTLINHPPVAHSQVVMSDGTTPSGIILTASDVENDPLTYTVVDQPTSGTLSGSAPNLTYTPDAGFSGNDSFTFKVNDGTVDSAVATVIITSRAPFVMKVKTDNAGISADDQFTLSLDWLLSYDFAVEYDGQTTAHNANTDLALTFPSGPGTYDIAIYGTFPAMRCQLNEDNAKVLEVKQWGGIAWESMAYAFAGCSNLQVTAIDIPDLSGVTDMHDMFWKCSGMTSIDVTGWDVSNVTTMNEMFRGCTSMLTYTGIAGWDVGKVQDFGAMFYYNRELQSLDLTGWNTSSATSMLMMFYRCDKLLNLTGYESWDVSNVSTFYYMFERLAQTSLDISNWNTSGALRSLKYMFVGSNLTEIKGLENLNVANLTSATDMFLNSTFQFTTPQYDALLIAWDQKVVTPPTNTVTFNAKLARYTPGGAAEAARASLISKNWVIIDDGPYNAFPVADDQAVTVTEDVPKAILLTASDGENDPLTYSVVSEPSNGVLSGTAPDLTYTPNANVFGADSFTFMVNDGRDDSNVATVSITTDSVNDAPVATDQSLMMEKNNAVAVTLTASDVEGDPLDYSVVIDPASGTLSGTAPDLTYTPDVDFSGDDSFTFKANDGADDSNVATISITVNAGPVALDQTVTVEEDGTIAITLNTSRANDAGLIYAIVDSPTDGVIGGSAPNVTYSPNPGYLGTDSFTFKATDAGNDSNIATVTINVVDTLVAHYEFDDAASRWKDSTTYANHGSPVNTPTLVTGTILDGAQLDGTNYVSVPDSASLDIADEVTLMAWIWVNDGTGDQNLLQKGTNYALFEIRGGGTPTNVLNIGGTWNSYAYTRPAAYFVGGWHHVAITYDGTTVTNYLDGVVDGTFAQTGTMSINGDPVAIGANAPWYDAKFKGKVDDARIYRRALSAEEIYSLIGENLAPEITALGLGLEISDDDTEPRVEDDTDFGTVPVDNSITHTFTIKNDGNGALELTSDPMVDMSGDPEFTISLQPSASTVAAGGTLMFDVTFTPTTSGVRTATISIDNDDSDENPYTFVVQGNGVPAATLLATHIFYNNSDWDGDDPTAGVADDLAIATDKLPLRPGASATATVANYTSYLKGINGIMIDVDATVPDTLTASDFTFMVGNTATPTTDAPLPTTVKVRPITGGSRITLIWADDAIKNTWLQVTVKAGGAIGLASPHVFYYGNAVAETGNSVSDTAVDVYDMLGARNNVTEAGGADVENTFDFNRDKAVDVYDMLGARNNVTDSGSELKLISVP